MYIHKHDKYWEEIFLLGFDEARKYISFLGSKTLYDSLKFEGNAACLCIVRLAWLKLRERREEEEQKDQNVRWFYTTLGIISVSCCRQDERKTCIYVYTILLKWHIDRNIVTGHKAYRHTIPKKDHHGFTCLNCISWSYCSGGSRLSQSNMPSFFVYCLWLALWRDRETARGVRKKQAKTPKHKQPNKKSNT